MRRILFLVACTSFLAACGSRAISYDETVTLTDGKQRIPVQVEIAATPSERERGLMGRPSLADRTGMLFVFEQEQPLSFWMKDTLIPLDVIFFRSDGTYVSAETMVPCQADPCPLYSAAEPSGLALEVPAGFATVHSIGGGWSLRRER